MTQRTSSITRKTAETDISLRLTIEGAGTATVSSGNGFMDHMLTLFACHGLFDLELSCRGDLDVDFHHSAEDIGICLGQAVREAAGTKKGIMRYGTVYVPMDEALARVCLDLSGRPTMVYTVELVDRVINTFECDLVQDFFKALSDNAGMTLHIDLIRGRNSHHAIEALFKAFARALSSALQINPRACETIPSSKGVI